MKTQNLFLLLLGVAFGSCQTSPLNDSTESLVDEKITLNTSTGASTKVDFAESTGENGTEIKLSWQTTDSFSVYTAEGDYVGDFEYSNDIDGTSATFAQVSNFSMTDGSYVAVIPVSGEASLTDHYASLSLSSQTSTSESLSYLNNSVQLRAEFDYDGSGTGNLTFSHELSLIKVSVTMPEGQIAKSINFTDGDGGDSYTLTLPEDLDSSIVSAYISVLPNDLSNRTLYFEVLSSDGSTKEYSSETTKTLETGKFYSVSLDFSGDTNAVVDYYLDGYKADNGSTYVSGMSSYHKLYNGVLNGDETAESFGSSGVYFLDPEDEDYVFEIPAASRYNFVLIGRYADKKPKVRLTGVFYPVSGSIIFKNVELEGYASGGYSFGYHSTATTIDYFVFDDCSISTVTDKPLAYLNLEAADISNTVIRNSKIAVNVTSSGTAVNLLNFNKDSGADKNITLHNNEIYAPIFAHGPLLQINTASTANLSVTNNSFVNYHGNTNGFFKVQDASNVEIANNIFWASPTKAVNSYILNYVSGAITPSETISDNIFYGLGASADDPTAYQYYIYATSSKYINGTNPAQAEEDSSPFSTYDATNGVFTQKDEYSAYGSTL